MKWSLASHLEEAVSLILRAKGWEMKSSTHDDMTWINKETGEEMTILGANNWVTTESESIVTCNKCGNAYDTKNACCPLCECSLYRGG